MFRLGLGKYRTIIISITLFLVFDVGVLAMTFLISKQIASDAVSLNLAGQQRTLVQQLTKTALLLEQDATQGIIDSSGQSSFSELKELTATADQFNATLEAFHQGGRMVEGRGKVELTPQDDIQAAAQFKLLEELWVPINVELQKIKKLTLDIREARSRSVVASARRRQSEPADRVENADVTHGVSLGNQGHEPASGADRRHLRWH